MAVAKPPASALPEAAAYVQEEVDLVQHFSATVRSIGADCVVVKGWEALLQVYLQYQGLPVLNGVGEIGERTIMSAAKREASALESLHAVLLRGRVGVAENGAIWIPDSETGNRLLPFICEQLLIAISAAELVPTLREAYARIDMKAEGYGVFIAGPSKSADIEQSLVIGAHGPLSLRVFVVE